MKLTIISVPYDSGHYEKRMGRGPHLLEVSLVERLQEAGTEVELESAILEEGFWAEVAAAAELQRLVSRYVSSARAEDRFPLILAGNCNSAEGTVAGLSPDEIGVIWFDAHGDFNTPDISASGFFDGMALSMLTGNSWRGLWATVPGFHPVAEQNVILVGARDLDPQEMDLLNGSRISQVGVEDLRRHGIRSSLGSSVVSLSQRVKRVYVHIDLDVLDPSQGRANQYAAAGGLTVPEAVQVLEFVGSSCEVAAAALTAYDPKYDEDGRCLQAAEQIVRAVIAAGAQRE